MVSTFCDDPNCDLLSKLAVAVMLQTYRQEAYSSNLSWNTDYTEVFRDCC
jgi:hypothetical protein